MRFLFLTPAPELVCVEKPVTTNVQATLLCNYRETHTCAQQWLCWQLCRKTAHKHLLSTYSSSQLNAKFPWAFTHPNALHENDSSGFTIILREVTRAVSPHPHTYQDCVFAESIHSKTWMCAQWSQLQTAITSCPSHRCVCLNNSCSYWTELNNTSVDWSTEPRSH